MIHLLAEEFDEEEAKRINKTITTNYLYSIMRAINIVIVPIMKNGILN